MTLLYSNGSQEQLPYCVQNDNTIGIKKMREVFHNGEREELEIFQNPVGASCL